jgi:uncharacterized protein
MQDSVSMGLVEALQSGASSLASYLAAHVLLCLVPAFFVAGALSSLVPKEKVTRLLGRDASKWVAYPVAAVGGSLIAVCSCTVLPLFAGIYRKGAGLGPAMTFLFFAPAGNVLALSYTGVALGGDFALARVVLSAVFGIGIGLAMASLFPDDAGSAAQPLDAGAPGRAPRGTWWLLAALVALLLAGTLRLSPLTAPLLSFEWQAPGWAALQNALLQTFPFDAARGEESVTPQGLGLIALLAGLGVAAWRGLDHVDERLSVATWVALGLAAATLLSASLQWALDGDVLRLTVPGRSLAVGLLLLGAGLAARRLDAFDAQQWLWESWRFVKQIFPLLVVGVFLVGVARGVVDPRWIEAAAGENTLGANLVATAFGVVMYFPTLVEVPVAKLFLSLGMHPGPLLAYLMADPELSLQSLLVTSKLLGVRRTVGWVALVSMFSVGAGLLWGGWNDGQGAPLLAAGTAAWLLGIGALVKLVSWLLARFSTHDQGGSLHAHQDPR